MGVYISPPLVFVSRPGGTKILGMLAFSKLVMCALFTPRIILEEGELLFKHSSPLGGRVPREIVFLAMLDPL